MSIHMQSTKAQQGFGEVMENAMRGEDVIIERYGTPRVVVVDYRRYQKLLEAEKEFMRSRLRTLSERAAERASYLTDEEVDILIEESRKEANA